MKKVKLLVLTLFVALTTQAQITITSADYPLNITKDSINYSIISPANQALPQAGADMIWDYTNLTATDSFYYSIWQSTNPTFPTADFQVYSALSVFGETLDRTDRFSYDTTGLLLVGRTIYESHIPLQGMTGNSADTLSVLNKDIVIEPNSPELLLPMSYGQNYVDSFIVNRDFVITAAVFGLNNFSFSQKQEEYNSTSVEGWGKLVLENPTTMMLDTFETLLRIRTSITIDSFFDAANNPLPQSLLTPFGYSQGNYREMVYYTFFVKGLNSFALRFLFEDGILLSIRGNPDVFKYGQPVNTHDIKSLQANHTIYPNPIQNHQFQLEINTNKTENWQLDIYNLIGQSIHNELITNNVSTIQLNNNLPSGQYFYTIKNETGEIVANGKLIK